MKQAKQGNGSKVMAKKELADIKIYDGEKENSKIFVLSQSIKGLSTYDKAKAINHFLEKETKVLETCVSNYCRQVLILHNIIPQGGSNKALEIAFYELNSMGYEIEIYDRYANAEEKIIGENNDMTVINEDDVLSAAIEVDVVFYG